MEDNSPMTNDDTMAQVNHKCMLLNENCDNLGQQWFLQNRPVLGAAEGREGAEGGSILLFGGCSESLVFFIFSPVSSEQPCICQNP